MPKISIITPVYNVEKYLDKCLKSILVQTFTDFEVICINDGSTDRSFEILNNYKEDNRVKIIDSENHGVGYARNLGLDIATGEYMVFIDSDDYVNERFLEKLLDNVNNTDSDMVCCGRRLDTQGKITTWLPTKKISYNPIKDIYKFTKYRCILQKLFKTDIIKKNNIRFDTTLHLGEDTLFLIEYLTYCRYITSVQEGLYTNNFNDQSLTRNPEYQKRREKERIIFHAQINKIIDEHYGNGTNIPKVSVVMPIYNAERYLRQSLDSVVNQTLKEIEIICVNDASTDGSLSILEEYQKKDDRIKIVTNKKNLHCGSARNVGIRFAKGEYLIVLDGDDWFELNMLESLYKQAKIDDSDITVCEFYNYDEQTKTVEHKKIKKDIIKASPFSPSFISNELFQAFKVMTWNKLFKRSFFLDNDLCFDDNIVYTEVSCICTALVISKKISVVPKPFIYYRTNTKTNLTFIRKDNFHSIVYAMSNLEIRLKKLDLYKTYKNTFVTMLKNSFIYELQNFTNKQLTEKIDQIEQYLSYETYVSVFGKGKEITKKRNKMDLVYLVKEDEWNEDLKYSLRSVDKFVPCGNVWIVGYKPSWVQNVKYLPVEQYGTKHQNQTNSLLAICNCDEISDDFVLMNDDFFAIKPINDLEESVEISLGLLEESVERHEKQHNMWHRAFKQLYELLEKIGVEKPYYDYESHTPLKMNRHKLLHVLMLPEVQDYIMSPKVLHRRSLYRNYYHLTCKVLPQDVKLSKNVDNTSKKKQVCDWISVYDNQVGNPLFINLNNLLNNLFPDPCKYETDNKPIKNNIKIEIKNEKYKNKQIIIPNRFK